ncbi:MAG: hypothetical protein Ct9H300mP4_09030 [Gammaproteobacteria bacterium]|nr:MAG: hypothetical protein Ct9H300mP4_09030 [Gammaproteobacteria bacterium]
MFVQVTPVWRQLEWGSIDWNYRWFLGQFENIDYQLLAAIAANVHATAGDLAVEDGERGLIATDFSNI